MTTLTQRQREVLDFVQTTQQRNGFSPTLREICKHFGFRSPKAAADHLAALERKGYLSKSARLARSLRIVSPLEKFASPVVQVPVFGTIPAGFADEREQSADGCVSVDLGTLGVQSTKELYALRVRGESMIGKHIMDGDLAILDRSRSPRAGDVVAALIDGESTLKTFATENGRAVLRAENPRYPKLVPANSLTVQGVLVALVRQQPAQ
jgi:repressor LexA